MAHAKVRDFSRIAQSKPVVGSSGRWKRPCFVESGRRQQRLHHLAFFFPFPPEAGQPFDGVTKETRQEIVESSKRIGADAHEQFAAARASLLCRGQVDHRIISR